MRNAVTGEDKLESAEVTIGTIANPLRKETTSEKLLGLGDF